MHIDAGGGDTLSAVIIGAVLATLGGFAATQLETHLRRRERERSAALLFGEVLSLIELLTNLANDARCRGDPYGGFTMRMTRTLRREIEVYDRNRESLYDLHDAAMRATIHSLVARMTLGIDGVLDMSDEIRLLEATLAAMPPDDPVREKTAARFEYLRDQRELAFDNAVETAKGVTPILAMLERVAKESFETYASTIRP